MTDYDLLTPTEQLILEVLAARWRLADSECWTFPSKLLPQLRKLQDLGLLTWKYGVIEKTALAWLEPAGMDIVLSPLYVGRGRRYESTTV